MRHDQPDPGKFEGNGSRRLATALYNLTLDGLSTELGDVQDFGWYGLVERKHGSSYIVHEDSQGFFDYDHYTSEKNARKDWAKLEKEYEEFCQEKDI